MFLFSPLLGKMMQFDEHIFQKGWNRQLGIRGANEFTRMRSQMKFLLSLCRWQCVPERETLVNRWASKIYSLTRPLDTYTILILSYTSDRIWIGLFPKTKIKQNNCRMVFSFDSKPLLNLSESCWWIALLVVVVLLLFIWIKEIPHIPTLWQGLHLLVASVVSMWTAGHEER